MPTATTTKHLFGVGALVRKRKNPYTHISKDHKGNFTILELSSLSESSPPGESIGIILEIYDGVRLRYATHRGTYLDQATIYEVLINDTLEIHWCLSNGIKSFE